MTTFKLFLIGSLVVIFQIAYADTIPLTSCSELKAPNTVLVVHVDGCPHCQHFLPKYRELSNNPKYSNWKFYTKEDSSFHSVCGADISSVPMTFKNNMGAVLQGDVSMNQLKEFLK